MIRYCPIYPKSMIEESLKDDGLMVLAHLYESDVIYRRFVNTHRKEWEYVILDNGEAEHSQVSKEILYNIALELMPTVVVLPDTFREYPDTFAKTKTFIEFYGQDLIKEGIQLMGVPQGSTPETFIKCYDDMVSIPELEWLGINKNPPISRAEFILGLCGGPAGKHIHLLGLANPLELMIAEKNPNILYMDSAIPINYGYNGKDIPLDFGDVGKIPSTPDYFNFPAPSKEQKRIIESNIAKIRSLCNGEY